MYRIITIHSILYKGEKKRREEERGYEDEKAKQQSLATDPVLLFSSLFFFFVLFFFFLFVSIRYDLRNPIWRWVGSLALTFFFFSPCRHYYHLLHLLIE